MDESTAGTIERPECGESSVIVNDQFCYESKEMANQTKYRDKAESDTCSVQSSHEYLQSEIIENHTVEPFPEFSNVDIKEHNRDVTATVSNTDTHLDSPLYKETVNSDINKIIAGVYKATEGQTENGVSVEESLSSLSKEELVAELRSCKQELISLRKQLSKSERQVKKADDYNEVLRTMLDKVSSQVHDYKTATYSEAAIQVDKNDLLNYTTGEPCMPDWGTDPAVMDTDPLQSVTCPTGDDQLLGSDEAPMSLAESIKMAAQDVLDKQTNDTMLLQGYVYDETYGLYYHSASGYYYDSEKQLYYEPNTGTYYYYDYNTGQYAFHSQVNYGHGDAFTVYRESTDTKKVVKKMGKKPKRTKKMITVEEGFKNRRERRMAIREIKEKERCRRIERRKERRIKDRGGHMRERSKSREGSKQRSPEGSLSPDGKGSGKERSLGDRSGRKRRKSSDEDRDHRKKSAKRHKRKKKKEKNVDRDEHQSDIDDSKKSSKRHKHKKKKHRSKREQDSSDSNKNLAITDHASKETDGLKAQTTDNTSKTMDGQSVDHPEVADVDGDGVVIIESNQREFKEDNHIEPTENKDDGIPNDPTDKDSGTCRPTDPIDVEYNRVTERSDVVEDNHHYDTVNDVKADQTLNSSSYISGKDNSAYEPGEDNSESSQSSEESGEITDSSSSEHSEEDSEDSSFTDSEDDFYLVHDYEEDESEEDGATEDIAQSWPPCVRVIVTESDSVAVGMLYIVTYQGTKIGRGKENGICIPDINISKCHAEIQFNETDRVFTIIDKGSQNGTFLNEERISQPKQTSEPKAFKHADVIQIGDTKLLCHIHNGTDTCDECEPGIVMAKYREQLPKQEVKFVSKEERKKLAKKELNQIKKRYGLKNAAFEVRSDVLNNPNYEDKAAERRKTVGSDAPSVVKETPASVFRPISSENKGHKMLEKMGWKEGESLGKDNSGIQEPIAVSLRAHKSAGLGSAGAGIFSPDDANSMDVKKAERRIQAMQRYDQLEKKEKLVNNPTQCLKKPVEPSRTGKNLPEKYKMSWSKGDTEYT